MFQSPSLSLCLSVLSASHCKVRFIFWSGGRQGGSWGGNTFPHFSPTLPMANFLARCEFYEQVCNEISVSCGRHSVYWQALVCPTLNIGSLKLLWVSFVRISLPPSLLLPFSLSVWQIILHALITLEKFLKKQNNWKSKSYLSYGKTIVFLLCKVCLLYMGRRLVLWACLLF